MQNFSCSGLFVNTASLLLKGSMLAEKVWLSFLYWIEGNSLNINRVLLLICIPLSLLV
jgi:hypothetical protein